MGANANSYVFKHKQTTINWYPSGKGGPAQVGQPPANTPVLIYNDGTKSVTASGSTLSQASTPAGTFVIARISLGGEPGVTGSVGVLVPDTVVDGAPVSFESEGVLSETREVSDLGPGVRETYKWFTLKGTASFEERPA